MPTFAYEARDENGELTGGSVIADSLDHAGAMLSQRNLFVVRLAGGESETVKPMTRGHATRAQVAWQMSQLSVMIETGIPLSEALECLSRQAAQPRLRELLEQVSRHVHEGRSLSEAMAQFPKSFPSSLVALIRASEMSGTMSLILRRSSAYLMNELQVLKRVRGAVLYPAFMFTVCMAVTVFLLVVILPKFADIFASRGAILPLPTRILMALSRSMIHEWYFWLGGAATLLVGLFAWMRTEQGKRHLDFLAINAPVFSVVFNKLYQSRTFRTMAVLLDAGVPLIDVMQIVREVVPNSYYRDLWKRVDDHIRKGERMAGPLLESDLIPEPIAQMIDSGDRSGKLGLVFNRLADFVEEEYQQAVKTATQFIEPCMILFMGTLIGFVAASLMLPLFQASQVVAK